MSAQAPVLLLVEDEDDIRGFLRNLLKDEGFDIYEAEDGVKAVAIAEKTQPDVILMDLNLPLLDGRGAAEQIRHYPRLSGVPIIFMSAFGGHGMDLYFHIDDLGPGPIEYVTKPITDFDYLLDLIRALVNGRDHGETA